MKINNMEHQKKKKKKMVRYFADTPDQAGTEKQADKSEVTPTEPSEAFKISQAAVRHEDDDNDQQKVEEHDLSNWEADWRYQVPKRIKRKYPVFSEEAKTGSSSIRRQDPFPGDAPISKEKLKKYKRGKKVEQYGVQTAYHKAKVKAKEDDYEMATKQAARAELLLTEDAGFIQADEEESISDLTQHEIAASVDIASAQKFFELKLDKFGPYRINYTRNGRYLLMGGAKGHVAAFDWQTKKLMCEMNVMETCQDVKWLHIETMFAVAQKRWTYVYDNQGIELHCLKGLDQVLRMEFLPYHFLLVTAHAKGYLGYMDVSVGKKVAGISTHHGRLDVMCQNSSNAIVHLGHSRGAVTLWSPNVKEPLVKMLCHGGAVRSMAVDRSGNYMATSGTDSSLKIWDLRTLKALHAYRVGAGASHLAFSQKGILAAGIRDRVEVYKDCLTQAVTSPYLVHQLTSQVRNLQFCPYEDVLGVGHGEGFSSLLIPGSGEPNFDALEDNPYQNKKQRRHAEVKMLLEKIQPDMITMDTSALGRLDVKTVKETMEEKQKLLFLKPQKVEFEPRYRKKGASKTGRLEMRKRGVKEQLKMDQVRRLMKTKGQDPSGQRPGEAAGLGAGETAGQAAKYSALDRFKTKT